ncbi:DUF554 family protein [Eubacterium callanderi]|uniref:DUF554 family protein n=1 Tax=Eubacterium callanderi TaxID=53442 RepID=UPI001A9B3A33
MSVLGTIINVAAILVGGFLGLLFRKGLPERISATITHGLSLGIMMLGISMGVQTQNFLIVLISLALGAVIGEALNIEGHLNSLGGRLERKFEGGENSSFAQGFVTASLLYCTGSMAIMGAIEGGISGTYTILVTKALLDGIFAIIFASTMGVGVLFAAVPVLLYQGAITLAAGTIKVFLTNPMITEMNAVGGVLIMGIGINLLEIKSLRLGNLIPAIFLPILLLWIMGCFGLSL